MTQPEIAEKMIAKLNTRVQLDSSDEHAVRSLPFIERHYEAPAYILREGEPAKRHCSFIVSGLALRQKITATGARQIVSIQVAGDFLDLQHLFLDRADHSVEAMSRLRAAEIDRGALQALALERPNVGRALWIDALVDASIFREWIVNCGRRDAKARVAHLLCEFAFRLRYAGLAPEGSYELPMTQEQLGDAVGLTSVHVNRTLKLLAADGLIERDKHKITFSNWERLSAVGDFSALYLHLDQAEPLK